MDANALIIPIAGTVAGGIILWFLLFPLRQFITQRPEKKKELDRKLRIHFKELEKEARKIIPQLTQMDWEIVIRENLPRRLAGREDYTIRNIIETQLSLFDDSLAAHFPQEASQWASYKNRIIYNNQSFKISLQKLRDTFEKQGIPVVNVNSQAIPCVYDSIFAPLYRFWEATIENKPIWPDFNQIEQNQTEDGSILLYAKGWNSAAIARIKSDNDKGIYETIIKKVAQNNEHLKETAKLRNSAKQVVEEINDFKTRLNNKLDDLERFELEIEGYKFKIEKKCPRCKEIFG